MSDSAINFIIGLYQDSLFEIYNASSYDLIYNKQFAD